jgi:hypothetical protein
MVILHNPGCGKVYAKTPMAGVCGHLRESGLTAETPRALGKQFHSPQRRKGREETTIQNRVIPIEPQVGFARVA